MSQEQDTGNLLMEAQKGLREAKKLVNVWSDEARAAAAAARTGKHEHGVTDKADSALGKRFVDNNGDIHSVHSVATYGENDGPSSRMVHNVVEKDASTGRWKDKGDNEFENHSSIQQKVNSGEWKYHSAQKGFEPGGKFEKSGFKEV